ncbi:unnamed protein product [Didymodactylos carnosus]|uniref:Uncharacterized protein n=1 Tax=Didymodactylos carnosus TaxID=1234261 RepID=A0A815JC51_9BILA|nr:unnamed protein product [Didymodactylos carnosus]CAF1433880.1 unnamed protein product [Didymodactylos carnosus]CAF4231503.1 unnamed protein product [Didymodactylos carnosus]CAF4274035.1 unnamed protein product [Didymodactylos carnosus]
MHIISKTDVPEELSKTLLPPQPVVNRITAFATTAAQHDEVDPSVDYLADRKVIPSTTKHMAYQWPPIILQIIRARYPDNVKNYDYYNAQPIKLTLDDLIELFH